MGAEGKWSQPAEGRPIVRKWHDAEFCSQRRLGIIMHPERIWLSPVNVAQQKLNEECYEANRREFQAQQEGVNTTAQRGSTPATGREVTCCAKMARRKEIAIGRNRTRDKIERGTRRLRVLRKRLWTWQEDRLGIKDLSGGSYVASRESVTLIARMQGKIMT
jgi:hypothetical protein